eukprot:95082-Amphidinium_carterae.1
MLCLQRILKSINLDRCNTLITESTNGPSQPHLAGRANSTALAWRQRPCPKMRDSQSLSLIECTTRQQGMCEHRSKVFEIILSQVLINGGETLVRTLSWRKVQTGGCRKFKDSSDAWIVAGMSVLGWTLLFSLVYVPRAVVPSFVYMIELAKRKDGERVRSPLRPKNCSTKGMVSKNLWNSGSTQFMGEWVGRMLAQFAHESRQHSPTFWQRVLLQVAASPW